MNPFARAPKNWKEVTDYIAKTALGRATLGRIRPSFDSKKITLEVYPYEIRSQLAAVARNGEPLGALFVTDGQKGTIYVDMQSELGVVLPFVFHEMIHSLDESLWSAAQKKLSSNQKKDLIFKSECLAFKTQHRFLEQLKEEFPELRRFLLHHYPKVPFLNREFQPHEIAHLYLGIEEIL